MEDLMYFNPGDLVKLNKDLPNSPIMMVRKKETSLFKRPNLAESTLKGIRCCWFTTTGEFQEAVFNTKDLKKYDE